MNNPEKPESNEITERKQVEVVEKVPIKINDLRDPSLRAFDLEKFLTVIERLRKEGLFAISREFQDSDYGKYMSLFASFICLNHPRSLSEKSPIPTQPS